MINYFLRIMLLSLVALNTSAANFKLIGSQSKLHYEITKFKSITVEGELATESKNTLTGNITVNDVEKASDLKGTITLTNPYFKSGSYQRDAKLNELIHGPVKVEIKHVSSYEKSSNQIEIGRAHV